jgi:hypothetical protein
MTEISGSPNCTCERGEIAPWLSTGHLRSRRQIGQESKACGFSGDELGGVGRHRPRSSARTLAAYLARAEGGISIARMARFFGREESTLVRAVLRLEQDLRTNGESQRQVARLSKAIQSF